MFKLAHYLKDYKFQIIVGPLCKLIEAIFELMLPLIMANIIDVGIKNGNKDYIIKGGVAMLLLGVSGWALSLVCQKCASIASQGSGTKLRNALYRHINTLSFEDLDKTGTASLVTRITNDINQIQLAISMLIRLVVRAPFLIIGAFVMAIIINVKIAVIFFAASLFIGIILYLIMSKSVPFFRSIQKQLDKLSRLTRETLLGNKVIRAFGKQAFHTERFNEADDTLAKTAVRVGRLSALLSPLTFLAANLAIVVIIWFGARFVHEGTMQTGEIIALINYMNQILLTMIIVANLVILFTKASASASRVNEVFALEPSVKETAAQPAAAKEGAAKIAFKNVTFSYGGHKDVLKEINLTIEAGETIGIIGTTGSGKSSLIHLIPRFYDTNKGEVYVDGVNVKDYPFNQLRGKIGLVPQYASLLSGTIKENMSLGNKEVTDEQVEEALAIAQAKEFVDKLPLKTGTEVVRGGKNFSGGQKQRLTIARAIAKDPEILILDDSTSALDFATDAALRKALAQEQRHRTVIIVSQRVASVRGADKIVVLKHGAIACSGTHQYLIENCEEYKEICLSQHQNESLDEEAAAK